MAQHTWLGSLRVRLAASRARGSIVSSPWRNAVRSSTFLAAMCVLGLGLLNGQARGCCRSDSPDGVLGCYARAYAESDISSLEDLLAPDYVRIGVVRPHAWMIARDATLDSARRLFDDPDVRTIALSFGSSYHVVEGTDPGTWWIVDIPTEFVHTSSNGESQYEGREVPSQRTIYVRRADHPDTGYVIYREVLFYVDSGSNDSDSQ